MSVANELTLRVRYAREMTDSNIPNREENLTRDTLTWSLPIDQCALILVDCWNDYPLTSFVERQSAICRDYIRPALDACRDAGMSIIHAPAPEWADNYPSFRRYAQTGRRPVPKRTWPPINFSMNVPRCATEPAHQAWWSAVYPDGLKISEHLMPTGDDIVIGFAEELITCCEDRSLLHLFYVGFCTNICVQFRDYGMRSMNKRGYNCILLRDCTTGIEMAETVHDQWITHCAVANIEMKVGVSTTAAELQRACTAIDASTPALK